MTTLTPYREIGHGHCGSVWTEDAGSLGTADGLAVKREDGGPGRSVHKDAEMHQRIQAALARDPVDRLRIPAFHRLVASTDSQYWTPERLSRYPNDATHQYEACNALISERIPPFAQSQRHNVIDLYCRPEARDAIKRSASDQDCLVRPYLGRKTHNPRPSKFFSLRNRPMNLDQLQHELRLPVDDYAKVMAEALATIYWRAGIDASDVEFVLAPAGRVPAPAGGHVERGQPNTSSTWASDVLGNHTMWILDFDCCRSITMDAAGVEQAAAAFYRNDPFFPRPADASDSPEHALWRHFVASLMKCSAEILGEESELPRMMVERLEQLGEERREAVRARSAD